MKKFQLVTLALLLTYFSSISNPVVSPQIIISEIAYSQDEWVIELLFFNPDSMQVDIDSIGIKSTATSMFYLSIDSLDWKNGLTQIHPSGFLEKFSLNAETDTLTIINYSENFLGGLTDKICWGSDEKYNISSLNNGESIVFVYNSYMKDASPTLGKINDTIGTCGLLKGKMYDKTGELVTNKDFRLDNCYFTVDGEGNFKASVFSCKRDLTGLGYCLNKGKYQYAHIQPIHYRPEPGGTISVDIHLTDSLLSSIDDKTIQNLATVKVFPNPVNGVLNVSFQKTMNGSIHLHLINIKGQTVINKKMHLSDKNYLSMDTSEIPTGMYTLQVNLKGVVISTQKIIVNSF